eukprot:98559_1
MMSYGSVLVDGCERGVDFTADSLHEVALGMTKYYKKKLSSSKKVNEHDLMAVESRVRTELRNNAYDEANNHVILTEGQVFAWKYLVNHYKKMNSGKILGQYLANEQDVIEKAAIFYWGEWLSAAAL